MAAEKHHARGHQFHGHLRPRPDLPGADPERCDALHLPLISPKNTRASAPPSANPSTRRKASPPASPPRTAPTPFAWPCAPDAKPSDLARPGHVFPLRARAGGVLVRAGQTEASVDLARMAGFDPGGVICEIMNDDGSMARVPQLHEFCERHGLKMISVASLIRYRLETEHLVERAQRRLHRHRIRLVQDYFLRQPASMANRIWRWCAAKWRVSRTCWCACTPAACSATYSARRNAIASAPCALPWPRIAEEGAGVLVYLHQTGLGARKHYAAVRQPRPAAGRNRHRRADPRGLGLSTIRLLTNHPRKVIGVDAFGIEIVGQVPI